MSKQKESEGNDNIMCKLSPETKNLHRSTNKCTGIKVGNESNAFWGRSICMVQGRGMATSTNNLSERET
jgi:hypothetical protein